MGENLDKNNQFSVFETIRDVLCTDSTLSKYFKKSQFYTYEPKLKSSGLRLPVYVIQVPNSDTDLFVLSHELTEKKFEVQILIKVDWKARDKMVSFINSSVAVIEANEAVFQAAGIHNPVIDVVDVDEEVEDQKQLVVAQLSFNYQGMVER